MTAPVGRQRWGFEEERAGLEEWAEVMGLEGFGEPLTVLSVILRGSLSRKRVCYLVDCVIDESLSLTMR